MIKGIIFDFDGVISDTEPLHHESFNQTLKELNIEIKKEQWYNEFAGNNSRKIMTKIFHENRINEPVEKWVEIRKINFQKLLEERDIGLKKGLYKFLTVLKEKGIKQGIASGSRETIIRHILKKNKIEDHFEVICGVESVEKSKPDPEIFLLCSRKLGLEPKECLIIEDSLNGVNAARKAGIRYICMESPRTEKLKECSIVINGYNKFPLEILEDNNDKA